MSKNRSILDLEFFLILPWIRSWTRVLSVPFKDVMLWTSRRKFRISNEFIDEPLNAVAMGVPWPEWPGYTSSICVELWRSQDGEHFVRVLFDRKEVAVPISRVEGAPKKVFLSFDEFCKVTEWSSLSETEFCSRCQDVSDITPATPNRILA